MPFEIHSGVWPTMITPFTEDNKPDFKAIAGLCEWYIQQGCAGIFSICQSSEMFYLSEQEKLDIARVVAETVDGRIQVIASGHTAEDKASQFREIEQMMKIPGIEAYVLVSNRLDPYQEGEAVFSQNAQEIFDRYPEIDFGIYECPAPYKRLVSTEFLRQAAAGGRMVFLKDTSCDYELIRERIAAVEHSSLKIFNANAASWFDSLTHGGAGYNGIMANFHPDLYRWCFEHRDTDPVRAKTLSDFLTLAAMLELRLYPVSAKYYHSLVGVPMGISTRSADPGRLDKNARQEVLSLIEVEKEVRRLLEQ